MMDRGCVTLRTRLVRTIVVDGELYEAGVTLDAVPALFAVALVLRGAAVFVEREAGVAAVVALLGQMHDAHTLPCDAPYASLAESSDSSSRAVH